MVKNSRLFYVKIIYFNNNIKNTRTYMYNDKW